MNRNCVFAKPLTPRRFGAAGGRVRPDEPCETRAFAPAKPHEIFLEPACRAEGANSRALRITGNARPAALSSGRAFLPLFARVASAGGDAAQMRVE